MAGGYKKLDMIIETVQDDQQAVNVRSSNKTASDARDIRNRRFTFRDFYKEKQLSSAAYKFGDDLAGSPNDERAFVIKQEGKPQLCVELFKSVLTVFNSSENLQFILTLLSDITENNNTTILLVRDYDGHELGPLLLSILGRHDNYCQHQACLCFARVATFSPKILESDDLNQFLGWSISQLKHTNDYLECVTKSLMIFLRRPEYRLPFYEAYGVKPVLDLLDHRINFQLQYELIFSLWMLSFDTDIVNRMNEFPIAAVLSDVLKATNRAKVQRIILATFRNLMEKAESDNAEKYAAQMIHFKAVQVLSVLESKSLDDPDFEDDVQFLQDKLKLSLQDLSSFDEYATEVKSRRLEWSPVHKSDKFWRENVTKLNDNDYELLRLLVAILKESQNPLAKAVASHDLGEYVRYYPRGKNVIDKLGAKELVMNLVNDSNTEVRMQALLSIQKMMVQNWEYLGKQLEAKS